MIVALERIGTRFAEPQDVYNVNERGEGEYQGHPTFLLPSQLFT